MLRHPLKYPLLVLIAASLQIKAQKFEFTNLSFKDKPNLPAHNLKTTTCTVAHQSEDAVGFIGWVDFSYNNKVYHKVISHFHTVLGAKYLIQFDSLNPDNNFVMFDKPIFLPDEKTFWAIAILKRINNSNVHFVYEIIIDGKKIKKYVVTQAICCGKVKKLHPELKKGQKFNVRYSPENPNRAIVYIDKPIVEQSPITSE